ncbi:MAG: ATPase, T2SS/T4P/T4SS family [Candidatus Eremiobacteraeota bacterium]|nr:ATPase, T2SS/T4P/T4SS family [Candidatus Eremiobacteraeota bacterium]
MPKKEEELTNKNIQALKTLANVEGQGSGKDYVTELILEADNLGASDIHFEPYKDELKLRMRIDGTLRDIFAVPKKKEASIISCIKVMGGMDITEKRLPQDGRVEIEAQGRSLKVRIASIPQVFGEKVVMRLFSKNIDMLNLDTLGFTEENQKKFEFIITRPSGMVLVSGPTGAGKTTTLYAAMNRLNSPEKNLVSIEDPIEYIIDRINQIQINPAIDFNFATILRAILRQDPDIITVGEIRDLETASMAVRAALTGHLLLSTFHANKTTACITRLIDMGVMPFMLAAALNGAIVQKLARRICPMCVEELPPSKNVLQGHRHFKGKGCRMCNNTGLKGRIAIHEVLVVSGELRDLIQKNAGGGAIFQLARKEGLKTLQDDAVKKVLDGIITYEEAVNVTFDIL